MAIKKDGETRDRLGRWAGKVVTVRKEYYALIESWQRKTGMTKAEFWRQAVMRGALEVAKSYGIDAAFPVLEESQVKSTERKSNHSFPFWNFKR